MPYFSYCLWLIPEELRGRVISVCRLFPSLVRPLGRFFMGLCLQLFGPVPTLLINWYAMVLLFLLMMANRHICGAKKPSKGVSL
ncbi:MAG: hypothetical protein ACRDHZ_00945 [Ktedonobacteraceae bacterium]